LIIRTTVHHNDGVAEHLNRQRGNRLLKARREKAVVEGRGFDRARRTTGVEKAMNAPPEPNLELEKRLSRKRTR